MKGQISVVRDCQLMEPKKSYRFIFFFKLLEILLLPDYKKAHIFLITYVKFYSWKVFRLEDINENVAGYGNHNQAYAYTVR